MKIKRSIIGALLLIVPFGLTGQTVLYNEGPMYIKSNGVLNGTTLYIGGDLTAGYDATISSVCNISLDDSQTILTGNFIHAINGGTISSNTFTIIPSTTSRFVFQGTSPQSIKLSSGLVYGSSYDPGLKGTNYIQFPTLVINNVNHVTVAPELAIGAQNIELEDGRLILDSRRTISTDFPISVGTTIHSAAASSMLAHLLVESTGIIATPNNASYASTFADHNRFGSIQVNLTVDDPTIATAGEQTGRSIIGMGSPYTEMKTDYFFWNFLMIPKGESIIGNNTMTDPTYSLTAGKGFVLGVDLRGGSATNYQDIASVYGNKNILFTDRNGAGVSDDIIDQGKYYFSRFGPFFNRSTNIFQASGYSPTNPNLISRVPITTDAAYTKEVLNFKDIPNLTISQGYNYYANPYTVPLDLNAFMTSSAVPITAWGGIVVADATVTPRDFTDKVWILDPASVGSGSYDILNPGGIGPGNKWVMVNAKYRVMKSVASTVNPYDAGTGSAQNILAPLQMFVLYSPNGGVGGKTLTIPASARAITQSALFLRSAPTSNQLIDDFLFEVKDEKIKTSDRTAIAIRTPQEVMTDAKYEGTRKLITLISYNQTTTRSATEEGAVTQTNMSTVYTKSDSGTALESNILGVPQSAQSETVTLYVTPSLTAQNISITAGRLETANRVKGIMLKDKVKNNEFDLFTGKTYTIESKATDPVDRFSLRFIFDTSGIEDGDNGSESKSITSYYLNGTLTVTGFDDADFGSVISVYDIQGRMAAQAKVNDTTVEITQPFSPGAYIVKVVGNKSYVAKFLVK